MSHTDRLVEEKNCRPILSIPRLLQAQAERTPDAVAIAGPYRTPLLFAHLLHQIREVVGNLNSVGVGRNDRVAIVLPEGPEMAVTILAVAAGATAAPLNPNYRASEFDFYLTDLHAKALIVQAGTDSAAIAAAQSKRIPLIEVFPEVKLGMEVFSIAGGRPSTEIVPELAHPDDIALVLYTSGTTSRPKLVPLTHKNLCTSARNIGETLKLSASDRCLNVMPLFHIHGLVGALLSSLAAGASVVCTEGLHLAEFFHWIEEFKPSWYSATPSMHQAILTCAGTNRQIIASSPLRFIRSCSAPLLPQVMLELERVFDAPVIESYGMTEAAHQITSNPLPPLERKTGSVGLAAGPEVAILDEAGAILTNGVIGEIAIRGATVMQGYENNSDENEKVFSSGWFRTGDLGYLDFDGYLFITGRLKEMINRGGEKISPLEVDDILMGHPGVAQAATFGVPHKLLGEDIVAAVVLRPGASVTEKEIREFAAVRLVEFKVPRRVLIIDEIPKSPTGKVQRNDLSKKLTGSSFDHSLHEVTEDYKPPRTPLEDKLTKIWAKTLGIERVGVRDNFFDLGGYSLLAARMFSEIKSLVGKDFPPTTLLHAPTIERLTKIIRREASGGSWHSLVPIRARGLKPPLFCVHPCGGSVLWYYDLARHLSPDQPLYALQAQGLDGKESVHTTVEDMANHYIKSITSIQSSGPYFVGGFHFGGLVAYEMAQQLRAQGREVAFVVMFETYGPGYPKFLPDKTSTTRKIARLLKQNLHVIKGLGPSEKQIYVLQKLRNLSKTISQLAQEQTNLANWKFAYLLHRTIGFCLPVVVKNLPATHRQAARDYVPQVYPGRVTLFRAMEQPLGIHPDPTMGWGGLVPGGLKIEEIPGTHTAVMRQPHVRALSEKLNDCLA